MVLQRHCSVYIEDHRNHATNRTELPFPLCLRRLDFPLSCFSTYVLFDHHFLP